MNLIENGDNYGWSLREGKEAFDGSLGKVPERAKGLSVNNSYNLLVILAITRVSFQLK
ncbi:MAG: hypothetical protein ACI8XO_002302 [Verrucomicrobiales bacterium]